MSSPEDQRTQAPAIPAASVFEAYCPPHHRDMAAAVEAFADRKFGPGGPFNPQFYDRFFRPGSCLRMHADHMRRWHLTEEG